MPFQREIRSQKAHSYRRVEPDLHRHPFKRGTWIHACKTVRQIVRSLRADEPRKQADWRTPRTLLDKNPCLLVTKWLQHEFFASVCPQRRVELIERISLDKERISLLQVSARPQILRIESRRLLGVEVPRAHLGSCNRASDASSDLSLSQSHESPRQARRQERPTTYIETLLLLYLSTILCSTDIYLYAKK